MDGVGEHLSLSRWTLLLSVGVLCLILNGCNSNPYHPDNIQDPLEGFNRHAMDFNMAVDRHVAQPVSRSWRATIPEPARDGLDNFFTNLTAPYVVVNDLLQMELGQALEDSTRFVLNIFLGFGGFFDPAQEFGLDHREQNFGVTAAKWRLPEGPYLVLPLFGPHTISSLPSIPLSVATNPIIFVDPFYFRIAFSGVGTVSSVADTHDERQRLQQAISPYSFMQNAYYQRQRTLVFGEEIEIESVFEPLDPALLEELEATEGDTE